MSKNSRSTSRFSRSATWSKTCFSSVAADRVQPVHRPVARVVGHVAEPVDVHVAAHPLRRGQLRRGGERPVGDQAEQHPLSRGGVPRPAPPGGREPGQDLRDAEPVPQLVQDVRAAVGPGLGERQVPVGGGGQRVGGAAAAGTARRPAAGSRRCRAGLRGRSCRRPSALTGGRRRPIRCAPAAGTGLRRSWSSGSVVFTYIALETTAVSRAYSPLPSKPCL